MRRRIGLITFTVSLFLFSYSWCFIPTAIYSPTKKNNSHTTLTCTSTRRWYHRSYLSLNLSPALPEDLNLNEGQGGELDRVTLKLLDNREIGKWSSERFDEALSTMRTWSRWRNYKSSTILEHLLRRVVQEKVAGNEAPLKFDIGVMYKIVVESWATSGHTGSARRAEEILDNMQSWYEDGDLSVKPNIDVFNHVINAYAQSRAPDALQQALRVMQKLEDLRAAGKTDVVPNQKSYAGILLAYANKEGPEAPQLVKKMLDRMTELSNEGFLSVRPDYNCHNVYLMSLALTLRFDRISALESAKLAEAYLGRMINSPDEIERPDNWSFNIVLSLWSKTSDRQMVRRAETLVSILEEYHIREGMSDKTRPNSNTYNNLITCYGRSNLRDKTKRASAVLEKMKKLSQQGNSDCAPDHITYNAVMNAYAKSKEPGAPQKAEDMLRELNHLYQTTGDRCLKPSARSFNTCVHAWAKSDDPRAVPRILDWIEFVETNYENGTCAFAPNKWTYNSYLEALSKTGRPTMGDEAEQWLERMDTKFRQYGAACVKPDVHTFSIVINCIARSGRENAIEKAFAILSKMEVLHSSGYGDVRPNTHTYNCVINTIAKSKVVGKAKMARQTLDQMKEVALRPISVSYNTVLNACAFSDVVAADRQEIVRIAMETMKEAKQTGNANFITYGTCLRVISLFEDDPFQRFCLARDTFRSCCEDGHLTEGVLERLKPSLSLSQYNMLIEEAIDKKTGMLRYECIRYSKSAYTGAAVG